MDRKTFLTKGPLLLVRAFFEGAQEEKGFPAAPPAAGRAAPLRPPGAAGGGAFLELCCGIGACVAACPAQAILLQPREDDPARMAPAIVPEEAACTLCEGLACMHACPSGALSPVAREEIRIGKACIAPQWCLAWQGIDPGCNYCADRCPLGSQAIAFMRQGSRRGPRVLDGCTGCGQCEYFCPASPKAIRVHPL